MACGKILVVTLMALSAQSAAANWVTTESGDIETKSYLPFGPSDQFHMECTVTMTPGSMELKDSSGCVMKSYPAPSPPIPPPSSCKELYERGERKDGPYDLVFSDGTSTKVYCDMTTVDGGWTMVAKVKGQGTTMNRLNQHQWKDGTILGNSDDLSDVDALTQAYSSVPFTDVLIRGLTTGERHVAWSHPNQYDSMKAVNNKCERISDGVRLSGRVANLDLLDNEKIERYGKADGSTECPALKYGFFGYDWNDYRETQIAGCANNGPSSAAHGAVGAGNDNERMVGGHSGGFIAISTFKRTGTESGVNCHGSRLTDFGVGAGYHNMDVAIEKEAINAHCWGHGNAETHGFKTHAVFVR